MYTTIIYTSNYTGAELQTQMCSKSFNACALHDRRETYTDYWTTANTFVFESMCYHNIFQLYYLNNLTNFSIWVEFTSSLKHSQIVKLLG